MVFIKTFHYDRYLKSVRMLGIAQTETLFLGYIAVFFFPNPREKKKTVKSAFREVGRRSYVILWKKKP